MRARHYLEQMKIKTWKRVIIYLIYYNFEVSGDNITEQWRYMSYILYELLLFMSHGVQRCGEKLISHMQIKMNAVLCFTSLILKRTY